LDQKEPAREVRREGLRRFPDDTGLEKEDIPLLRRMLTGNTLARE
jgi:hypothetical protein